MRSLASRVDRATAAVSADSARSSRRRILTSARPIDFESLPKSLSTRKSVSPQEFDEVKARYQAALAHRDITQAGQAQAKAAVTQARTSSRTPDSCTLRWSDHREESRPWHVGQSRPPDLHDRGARALSIGGDRQRKRSTVCQPRRVSSVVVDALTEFRTKREGRTNRTCRGRVKPQLPGEDRIACGRADAFRPVRAGAFLARKPAGLVDSKMRQSSSEVNCRASTCWTGTRLRACATSRWEKPAAPKSRSSRGYKKANGWWRPRRTRPERQADRGPVMTRQGI